MDANQLLVIDVQGSVGVVLDDGSIRSLSLGDTVTVGDVVVTAANSSLMLDVRGLSLSIPANERVQVTPDLVAQAARDSSETTLFDESIDDAIASLNASDPVPEQTDQNADVSEFLQALEGDGDILDALDATAAGGNNPGGSGGGTSFVTLTRIAEGIDGNSLSFDDTYDGVNNDIYALRDTTDGVITQDGLPVSLSLNELGLINNAQPTISGSSENLVGETVTAIITDSVGNSQTVVVAIAEDGTFSASVDEPLADSPIVIDVTVIAPDGNPITDTITADIDTTAPVVSINDLADSSTEIVTISGSVIGLNAGNDVVVTVTDSAGQVQNFITQVNQQGEWSLITAPLSEGSYTVEATATDEAGNQGNDSAAAVIDLTAPIITIDAIAPTNDTTPVITGVVQGVPAGSIITIVVTDANNLEQTLTTQSNADGTWSIEVLGPVAQGDYSVVATVTDSAGNSSSATAVGLVDLSAPLISINELADSNQQTPIISGTSEGVESGTLVSVTIIDSDGQQQILTTTTEANGAWSVIPLALAEGEYTVTAEVTDLAGNSAQDSATANIDLTAPVVNLNPIADTADDTPVISGTVTGVDVGANVSIQLIDADGVEQVFTTTVLADGSFAVEVPQSLAQGEYTVTASAVDSAGNEGNDSISANIDLSVLSISIDVVGETNDVTPTISGSSVNAQLGDTVTVIITGLDGQTQTLVAETDANGDWSVVATQSLVEGEFSISATLSDDFGNSANANATGIIDITAPTISVDILASSNDTTPTISGISDEIGAAVSIVVTDASGTEQNLTSAVQSDGTWSVDVPTAMAEGAFTVDASVTDTAGNTASDSETGGVIDTQAPTFDIDPLIATNDTTPIITGTSDEVGATVTLTVTDASGSEQVISAIVQANGTWSTEVVNALAEGEYQVTGTVSDEAGNTATDTEVGGLINSDLPSLAINELTATNDTTPSITGSSDEIGATVTLTVTDAAGTEQNLTATVQTDGTWSVDVPTALAEGAFTVDASVTDAAGNTASDSETGGVIDTQAPIILIDELDSTNDVTPLITGQASGVIEGTQIRLQITDNGGNQQLVTTTVNADGSWSVEVSTALVDGDYTVNATLEDQAGNTASDTKSGNVDTTPPTLTVNVDTLSNDNTPAISGTSDAAEGASVTVVVTDKDGLMQTLSATVDANGDWAISPAQALPDGEFTVDVSVSDDVGNETTESVTGVIDTQAPTLTLQGVGDGNDVTPVLSGTSNEIGGMVAITIVDANGVEQTLTASVQNDGRWSVEVPNGLAEGDYSVEATITDEAGNLSELNLTGNIDTTPPVVTVNNNGLNNSDSPLISGGSTEPAGTTVSINVQDNNGDSYALSAIVQADGSWQVAAPSLPDGDYNYSASITDAAGNTGTASGSGQIDTQAPVLTIEQLGTINDTTPTLAGTSSEPEGTEINLTLTDSSDVETLLTATVDNNGNWSVTSPVLADDDYTVTATITDAAGNSTTADSSFVLNTNAPSISINAIADTNDTTPTISGTTDAADNTIVTVVIDDGVNPIQTLTAQVSSGTWSVAANQALAEGDFTVTASVTVSGNTGSDTAQGTIDTVAPLIDINPLTTTNDTTPTINGTTDAAPGSQVNVTIIGSDGVQQSVFATVTANGSWSVAAATNLPDGAYTVTAEVTDAAGNTASDTETGGVIDTQAPSFDIDPLNTTNDTTPTITGSSDEIGATVSVVVTDADGVIQNLTAIVQSDGSWSVDVASAMAEGEFEVNASVTDEAGNTSADTEVGGVIDISAPIVTVTAEQLTNDNTPLATGTSDLANSDIIVTFTDSNGSHSVTVQTDGSGQWQAEASQALADGNYSVSVSISDAAGNTGTATDSGVVDTIPPALAFTPTFLLGQLVTLTGTSDLPAGSTITITENLVGGGLGVSYTTTTDANGNWSLVGLTIPLLSVASVTASATDEAGNTRTINSLDFDGTPPTLTVSVDTLSNDNTPAVSGTTDAGEGATVTVVVTDKDGNTQTLNATVDDTGNWAVSPSTALPDGEFTVDVSVQDGVGNETTETVTGVIDTDAPSLTVNGVGDGRDVTPEFSGTSNEIGGTVTVTVTDANGIEQTLTATVQSDGSWSVEVPNALAQGDYTTDVVISDDAGNETQVSLTGNIDTSVPVVTVNNNGLGNDANPIISGTSTEPAGTQVSIMIVDANGDTQTLTAQVQAGGGWQVAAANLPDGDYSYSASITDAAGNTGSATGAGEIDTLAPVITLDNLGTINNDTPTISGTSSEPAGTVITVTLTDSSGVDTELSASVDGSGDWSVQSPALADGDYSITASVTDEAGNSSQQTDDFILNTNAPSITINAIGETNDTTPTINGTSDAANGTTVTVVIDDGINPVQSIEGTVNGGSWSITVADILAEGDFTVTASVTEGGLTSEASRTGVIDTTMPDITINAIADSNDTTPTISGTASAPQGSIVTVVFNDALGNAHTVTTQMTPSGTWSVPASDALAEGEYTVTASVSDQAGNPASTSMTGLIDLTPPSVSIDALAAGSDVTPLISGQSSGVPAGTQVSIEVTAANGAVQSISTTTGSDGSWSIEVANALAEGDYSVTASITDTAGNTGSNTTTGEIDTIAPSVNINAPDLTNDNTPLVTGTSDLANSDIIVTFTDSNGSHSVTVQTDGSGQWQAEASQALADGNYSVSVSLSDAAGNTGTATDSGVVDTVAPDLRIIPSFALGNLVSLSGESDLPEGSIITITNHLVGGLVGLPYTAVTDENGNWQVLNLTLPLLNLAHVTASATDAAGNTATVSTLDFDNIAPELTVSVEPLTNDTTPVISGDTDMGEGTLIELTVVDSDNVSQTFTAAVQADQTWSVSVPQELAQGTYTVTAAVRDGVGNLTTEQTSGVLDSVAPTLVVNNLQPTADTTPTISGSSNEIGGLVSVLIDGQILQATVATDGTWQVTVPTALTDGDYSVDVNITDDAGNQQSVSSTLLVDSIVPVLTMAELSLGNDATPEISGTSTEPQGSEVVIVLVDANGDSQQFTAQVQADGSYSASPSTDIADGDFTVTASITDAANNVGTAQGAGTVDTLNPSLTLNGLGTFNDSTPVISGTSDEIGATVALSVSDSSNSSQLTAIVQADGSWSAQVVDALDDGEITLTATVSDAAGNQASASGSATLDTNAPTISIANLQPTMDTTPTISGTTDAADGTDVTIQIIASGVVVQTLTTQALAGQWTVDASSALAQGSYTVNASVSEDGLTGSSSTNLDIDLTAPTLAINTPSISNDTTPSISGTSDAAPGTIVSLLITDSNGAEQTAKATVKANGTWSVALDSELAQGSYSIDATIADIAGNTNSAQTTGEIDLTPPTVIIDSLNSTADKTPAVSGEALDAIAGNTVAVTFTDALGTSHTVNTTLGADLTWQAEASQILAEGNYTVTVVVTDTAGNEGQQTANATIDSIAPEISIDQSSLVLTQDTTPLITGTSDEANATVEVTFTDANGIEQIVTVTTDAQGDWQAAANTPLAEGVYSVKATITDMAGNQGEDSKTGGEIDITPPELDIVPSFLLGNLVSLSGTSDLPEGSVVTITNHLVGGAVGLPYTATVDANGDWSVLNLSVSLLTLAYVEASATDAAGNTTTISTLDFDNTAPELTLSAPALTMDSTPTISGTTDLGEGAQVTLVVTGQGVATQTFSATVQANGSWSVSVPQSLADGQYSVKASVRDGVGNLTEQTASGVIDTTAPSLVLNTTAITSDDTPLISGTSNLTDGEVTVTIDGQTLTATVAQNGQWQVSANTLTDGTYTVTATVTDQAGNSTTRTGNISVDTVAPNITVASQGLGNDATPIISGTSDEAQGSTVSVVIVDGNGDTHNLTAVVDSNGDWQVEADALPEGEFDVTASITDAAGLTSSATTAGEIDTVAPVVTVDAVGTINLATPTITGSSDEPAGTVISVDVTDSTQTYSYTTQVQADGSWSIDVPDNLEDGSISVVASVTDLAGNTSTSDSVTGVLNTSAPSIGISPLAATNDTTPEISGTSDAPDASIINLVISNASGDVQSFTANLNAGVWSVDVPLALLEGSYTVTASVTEAGLTSSSSASLAIDLTAPTLEITSAQSSADSTPLISGTSLDAPLGSIVEVTILDSSGATQVVSTQVLANGSWSVAATTALAEGDAQVTAVITDTAGNSSNDTITLNMDYTGPVVSVTAPAITNDWTPLITGTVSDAPVGTLLTILITDSAGSKQTFTTNSNADGSWSAEAIQTLSDGQYTVQVSAADELGNTTTSSTTGLIDTLAPVIAITSGLVLTADTTPLISGTSNEPGGIVTVNFNNGLTQVEVTTTADASGNWSVSANANLLDANYTVTAEVTDAAGNTGSTSALGLEVDTTPVGFEVTNYYWGLLGIGLTAEGTVEEGSSVYVVGSNLLGLGLLDIDVLESGFEVQPNIFGEWSALLSVLDLGSWLDYRFVTVDEAGNYLVKDILNNVIDQGNEPSLATTSADTGGAVFGTELLAEQQSEPEASPASLATEPESTVESIDLSMILASEVATSNTIEPVDLTINDVLSDAEQPDLLALDSVSEESSIAFNGTTSTTAEPALDVQNQSEEMIKKLIESGNNQIDS
ncbi:beta strand repeat-containing protein [Pseudoalteromonas sp.]|uniref:beta strand repeat-containing protein n=1 Tax=Pseudoalteromonas sp. TaxID=53249 RepID=UPI0030027F2C